MAVWLCFLTCLIAAPTLPQQRQWIGPTEEQLLSALLAKRATWDNRTNTLKITGASDCDQRDLLIAGNMPIVKSLHIAFAFNDDALECLEGSRTLEALQLTGSQFTDKAITYVTAISSLKKLTIENGRLTTAGILALSEMEHLESLSLIRVRLSEQAVANLKSVRSLRELTLHEPSCVSGLSDCRELRRLSLEAVRISDFELDELVEELGKLRQLKSLSLSITESKILPLSAEKWFAPDFQSRRFVATRHYPLYDQLRTALGNTEISVKFEHGSMRIHTQRGRGNLMLD